MGRLGGGSLQNIFLKITGIHTHQYYRLPSETNLTRCNGGDIADNGKYSKKESYNRIAQAALHYIRL